MLKKTLATTALGFVGTVAHAQSSVTLYGLIDTGITYSNHVATSNGSSSLVKFADGVAQGSRIGLRGTEALGDGLSAIFTLEQGFNSGDGTLAQGGAEFGRQAWVGLNKNGVGALTLGRQYSLSRDYLHNYAMGHESVAGNYAYHINDLDQLTSSRINNAIKFSSASFGGFTFGALYGFSNQAGEFAGSPTTSSGTTTKQGSSRTMSFGVNYDSGPFGIGAAYTDIRFPGSATPAFASSIANINLGTLSDLKTFGVGASYIIGAGKVWGNWTHTQLTPVAARHSILNNYEIGGRYGFTTSLSAGLGYTFSDLAGQYGGKWHQFNSFVDYALSKRTDVYALAIYQRASGSNDVNGQIVPVQAEIGASSSFIGNSGSGANSQIALRLGLRHRF
ncbi:porin [Caballeronia peredens]|nr:porin [Caballeronia peredens]